MIINLICFLMSFESGMWFKLTIDLVVKWNSIWVFILFKKNNWMLYLVFVLTSCPAQSSVSRISGLASDRNRGLAYPLRRTPDSQSFDGAGAQRSCIQQQRTHWLELQHTSSAAVPEPRCTRHLTCLHAAACNVIIALLWLSSFYDCGKPKLLFKWRSD